MTTLVRWSPVRELDSMERQLRRMFDDAWLAKLKPPATDVYETDREYVLELEAPGFTEQELAIELIDHTLTVRGERKAVRDQEERTFRLHERLEKTFERSFELPDDIDTDSLAAEFGHGVLTVHAPKTTTARKVAIAPKA